MKYRTSILIVISLILFTNTQPAYAFLGFGRCERLTKELNAEQAIGYENWKTYDKYRDNLIKNRSFNFNQLKTSFNQMKIVVLSDMAIYKKIENNSNCFTAKFAAENRQKIDDNQTLLDGIARANAQLLKFNLSQLNMNVSKDLFNYVKDAYANFYDWKTDKKLNR